MDGYNADEAVVSAKAYAPGHITGFFEIHDEGSDPRRKGSTGCGLVLDSGVITEVRVGPLVEKTEIYLNGRRVEGKTTRTVLEAITDLPVRVESRSEIPVGCGFGASGAGALGAGYTLNQALSLNLTTDALTEHAHVAEVLNRSGLGDVAAQSSGGLVIRLKPGSPEFGKIDRIPVPEARVFCIALGEISTGSVLGDPVATRAINTAGKIAMSRLLEKPTLENFMLQAKRFALDTGLLSERAEEVIEAVDTVGGLASQAMLGDTVFAIPSPGEEFRLYEVMQEFGEVLEYGISTCIPKLMYA
ncbi:MAG: pantoate kinase [Methanosarcinaceae archaeon]|nr:pantoate kinase [Methanosarcinaceae archaeon]MDD4497585.1 pantoate kinase [Methanosarcinaceae archaeon]